MNKITLPTLYKLADQYDTLSGLLVEPQIQYGSFENLRYARETIAYVLCNLIKDYVKQQEGENG